MRGLPWLTASSVVSSAIGLVQNAVVARVLGVERFGILGILVAIGSIFAGATDIRLGDVMTRLYYARSARIGGEHRGDVLLGGIVLQAGVGILVALLSALTAAAYLAGSDYHPGLVWNASFFVGQAFVVPIANMFAFAQRFSERPPAMAALQVATAVARTAVIVAFALHDPGLAGVIRGLVVAAILGLALNGVGAVKLLRTTGVPSLRDADARSGLRLLWGERRHAISFHLVGYQNLLLRSGDVLLAAAIGGQSAAGLYRFARMCTDAVVSVFFDSFNRFFQPQLFRALQCGDMVSARRAARRIFLLSSAIGVALLAGEYVFLEPTIATIFGAQYVDAVPAVLILTTQIFFVCGVGLWAWPVIVYRGLVGRFVQVAVVSTAVGQYLIPWLGTWVTREWAPAWLAAGHCAHYVLLYAVLQRWLRFDRRELDAATPDVATGTYTTSPRVAG